MVGEISDFSSSEWEPGEQFEKNHKSERQGDI